MKKIFVIILFLSFVCTLTGQQKTNPVILKIGKQTFTVKDFEENINQMRVNYANLNPDMKKRLLDQFVKEKIFYTAAQDSGTKLTEEQKKNLEKLRTAYIITNYISKLLQKNPVY